ncbi:MULTISPECIES: acyl-CoA dehydrogenase family protein [Frankia]|uniref:Acyl-CoA dehydrogenase n=2 Tax=Frankia TaxID=1854 RepID=Q0RKD0_FRAAA|nr:MULTISPECIES: acyl-CoA dehydrogenase family protein [Frankia]CAJ62028.1 putative acyl-CoA dehydrogenase [Frankia alni ACN14a]
MSVTATPSSGSDTFPTGAWELPDEFRMLADTVRRFMETEVRPLEDTLPHDAAGLPPELLGPLQAKARAADLWALQTPAEFGGAGLSVLGQVVVAEEAAKCRMGAFFPACGAFGGNPPTVMFSATKEQFETYARPIIEGRAGRAFTAISEPSGGSDPARAIRCRAERDGDHYVINGTKMWTTHAGSAAWGVLYARTGEPGRRDGISCFILPNDVEGLTKFPIDVMTSYAPYELHFDNVRIPVANRIGEEGQGFNLASQFLVSGRIAYAAGPIGIAQQALGMAIDWVKQREVFGSRLADKQGIQWMIADSEVELRAARLLMYQAAWNADLGKDVRVDASVCKMYGTEAAYRVLDRCVQMFGALGLSKEMPLERWFRDLRVKRLGEGASEVQKMIIARELLR